ncbi:solute carrier family 49 member A3 [Spea bombifrons]|uniref:solute carrier family 49 member A3 n=1 Tax=Spea bombifrons TaxID=233779 RepID=UPI00234B6FB5|nr:solute carrier family 49 member A3 [Spea bombifrons]
MGDDERDRLDPDSERCCLLRKIADFKLYKRRWLILGAVCLLNCSNAMLWISFAPVADLTASFFNCTLDDVNFLSLVYVIISIPFGFGASWFLDTLGLRSAVILSSWLNMLGSLIRSASIISFLNKGSSSLYYLFVGQCLCATAQPLVLFVPAKLAAVWFPEHQRATANMIASMSNPIGILLANILSPTIVQDKEYIPLMMGIFGIPAVIACILATAGIWEKAPPTPPSASAVNAASEPFISGLKKLMKNKAYVILMLCFGAGLGLFTAFSTFLEQILCFKGYPNFFSGVCGALLIFFGVVGALVCGLYVDRTKKFTEVVKICFSLTALANIAFAVASNFRNQNILLAIICSLFGFFGFAIYPIAMELAVECSYPVGEGTSTGLAFVSGQIQGLIYMLLFQSLTKPVTASSSSSCGTNQIEIYDWSVSTLIMAGLSSLGSCAFVIFFNTDYKRLLAEANTTRSDENSETPE